jgi:hypothetical protein
MCFPSLNTATSGKRDHSYVLGRTIAEAVSRWLPTAAARVRSRVWQVGFMVDKVASGQVFSEYFDFPCQNHSFHKFSIIITIQKYKRKIEVSLIGEGPRVAQRALKSAN